jgi:hypothetical protein
MCFNHSQIYHEHALCCLKRISRVPFLPSLFVFGATRLTRRGCCGYGNGVTGKDSNVYGGESIPRDGMVASAADKTTKICFDV